MSQNSIVPDVSPHEGTEKQTLKENNTSNFSPQRGLNLNNILNEQESLFPLEKSKLFNAKLQLSSAKVDLLADLKPPEVAIYAINALGEKVPICTFGNFSMIIGKAKSKKTFFTSMIIAAALSEWPVGQLLGALPDNKNEVLHIDTEQGAYHVQRVGKRIVSMTKSDVTSRLHVYGLRRFTYLERVQLIEEALIQHPKVGLIVIDGSRDLIADINDAAESVLMVGNFMKWSEVYNIHIICVLHQNKGDVNARGHLGTESVNKAETVLSVTRDDKDRNVSIVDPEYCRDKDPDQIIFEIDQEGIPVIIDHIPSKASSNYPSIKDPNTIDKLIHTSILSATMPTLVKPTRSQLQEGLKITLDEMKIRYAKNDLSPLIGWYERNGYLKQEGTPGTRHSWFILI